MSGICSKHQGYEPECKLCNATVPPEKLGSEEITSVVEGALAAYQAVMRTSGGGRAYPNIILRNKVRMILGDLTKLPFAELPHDEYLKLTKQQKTEEYLTIAIVRALSHEAGE